MLQHFLRNFALFNFELLFPFLFNLTKFVRNCLSNFRNGFIRKNHNHAILPTWSISNQFDVVETHPSLFNKMVNFDLETCPNLFNLENTYPSLRRSRKTTSKQVKVPVLQFKLLVFLTLSDNNAHLMSFDVIKLCVVLNNEV